MLGANQTKLNRIMQATYLPSSFLDLVGGKATITEEWKPHRCLVDGKTDCLDNEHKDVIETIPTSFLAASGE